MIKLNVRKLTPAVFKRFGQVIERPKPKPNATMPGLKFWADVAKLGKIKGEYGIGFAALTPRPLTQDYAERHMQTGEVLIPVGGGMIVIAAPADYPKEPRRLPAFSRFAAFKVAEGQAVAFHPGVWHWAPFPVGRKTNVFVIFQKGTGAHDAIVVKLPQDIGLRRRSHAA